MSAAAHRRSLCDPSCAIPWRVVFLVTPSRTLVERESVSRLRPREPTLRGILSTPSLTRTLPRSLRVPSPLVQQRRLAGLGRGLLTFSRGLRRLTFACGSVEARFLGKPGFDSKNGRLGSLRMSA